jgi:hypothetical protein
LLWLFTKGITRAELCAHCTTVTTAAGASCSACSLLSCTQLLFSHAAANQQSLLPFDFLFEPRKPPSERTGQALLAALDTVTHSVSEMTSALPASHGSCSCSSAILLFEPPPPHHPLSCATEVLVLVYIYLNLNASYVGSPNTISLSNTDSTCRRHETRQHKPRRIPSGLEFWVQPDKSQCSAALTLHSLRQAAPLLCIPDAVTHVKMTQMSSRMSFDYKHAEVDCSSSDSGPSATTTLNKSLHNHGSSG